MAGSSPAIFLTILISLLDKSLLMRKMMLILLYFFIGIIGFVVLYFAADFVLSRIPSHAVGHAEEKNITAYVLSNGVHTDLVLPCKSDLLDWTDVFPISNNKGNGRDYNFVAIGWGDKGFYLNTPEWKDLTLKTALVAGLGIGETALHVTYYKKMVTDDLGHKILIDSNQFEALKNYILDALDKDEQGRPILIHTNAQYGLDDAFYEAKGAYSLFYSCNTWTNAALKKANMPSGIWTVFDTGVLRHYKK